MTTDNSNFYSQTSMGGHENSAPIIHSCQAKLLNDRIRSDQELRVLDIGSGAGVGVRTIVSSLSVSSKVTCVDLSATALSAASENGFLGVIAGAEGTNLPFADNSFDLVIIDEVIEHLVDTDSILDEIHRVLSPTGWLALSTPNLAAWFNRVALLFGIQPAFSEVSFRGVYGRPGSGIVGHLRLFTLRALRQFVEDRGFIIDAERGVPFPELPPVARKIDRLIAKVPSFAGGLVIVARPNQLST